MTNPDKIFMQRAIELASNGIDSDAGGPFGAVIVRELSIIGEGCNKVTSTNDPTAHAEIVAIRKACEHLQSFQLTGCTIYTSCEPCPMCLGAIYWARPDRIVYACNRTDAAEIGFDDQHIYDEIGLTFESRRIKTENFMRTEALSVFQKWGTKIDRIDY